MFYSKNEFYVDYRGWLPSSPSSVPVLRQSPRTTWPDRDRSGPDLDCSSSERNWLYSPKTWRNGTDQKGTGRSRSQTRTDLLSSLIIGNMSIISNFISWNRKPSSITNIRLICNLSIISCLKSHYFNCFAIRVNNIKL